MDTVGAADDAESTLLDADQAAAAAHIPIGTFWRWVHEGRLSPVEGAETGDGRQLYRESEVLDVERATRRAPRLRRLVEEARVDAATPIPRP